MLGLFVGLVNTVNQVAEKVLKFSVNCELTVSAVLKPTSSPGFCCWGALVMAKLPILAGLEPDG